MTYDRARVMRDAHAEWRSTKHKPGMTFGKCLSLAWKVEKKRAADPRYYQPMGKFPPQFTPPPGLFPNRDILLIASVR